MGAGCSVVGARREGGGGAQAIAIPKRARGGLVEPAHSEASWPRRLAVQAGPAGWPRRLAPQAGRLLEGRAGEATRAEVQACVRCATH